MSLGLSFSAAPTVPYLIFVGLLFCNESSLSDDDIIELFHSIQELEYKDSLNNSIIENLEFQIRDYESLNNTNLLLIEDYKKQIEIKEDMIKVVKPKWYHNRYLWFFGGVFFTSGTVYLAGQLDG